MADLAQRISASELSEWVTAQRWFASKTRDVAEVTLEDALVLCDDPELAITVFHAVRGFLLSQDLMATMPYGRGVPGPDEVERQRRRLGRILAPIVAEVAGRA